MKPRFFFPPLLALFLLALAVGAPGIAASGGATTVRLSENSAGTEGNGTSSTAHLSAGGQHVAFTSSSSNWIVGDNNSTIDIFVKDRASGALDLASVTTTGAFPNGASVGPSLSGDGRFVAFDSFATNLVPNDTNDALDVFLRDRQSGTTIRVTESAGASWGAASSQSRISDDGRWLVFSTLEDHAPNDTNGFRDIYRWDRLTGAFTLVSQHLGTPGDGDSEWPDVSADGRYVVFQSRAANFPGNDPGPSPDIYLADLVAGTMERISRPGGGSDGSSFAPRLSNDGRYVVFQSGSATLVPGDTNGLPDIFLFDRTLGTTTRISVGPNGEQSQHVSAAPDISGDGQTIAYDSYGTVLVPGDTNGRADIFIHDRATGATTRASLSDGGAQGNEDSERPSLSQSGPTVAFHSRATTLVPGDTNGRTDVFARSDSGGGPTPTPTATAPTVTPPPPTATATATPPTPTVTATPGGSALFLPLVVAGD